MTCSPASNPFTNGDADDIRAVLVSHFGQHAPPDTFSVFRWRAAALIGTLTPVLVWLRDHRRVVLTVEVIRDAITLGWIWKVANERVAAIRNPETGDTVDLDVGDDIPEAIIAPLRCYLGELPGCDSALPFGAQAGCEPGRQHSYLTIYVQSALSRLSGAHP